MKIIEKHKGYHNILGAVWDGLGTNFALYSSTASHVDIELFDPSHQSMGRYPLVKGENHIWHSYFKGVQPGDCYWYFIDGQYNPEKGNWHNKNLALLDPYARQFSGEFSWKNSAQVSFKHLNAPVQIPKNQVSSIAKYKGTKPNISWQKTVIYECHVKGATQEFPDIEHSRRGSFLGLAQPAFINHLKALGVTAVQLLPVHFFIDEEFLIDAQLSNYWGYNTLNFFIPHHGYLLDGDISEFAKMVSMFHQADIEVIIDVVFNHTAEGNEQGPTLCYRGIDNPSYYRLLTTDLSVYINDTGCGNTLNTNSAVAVRMVLDSLRYWVQYMGVDGFRFDLATILGRSHKRFKENHTFFQALSQDPVLNQVKLIAEPWDIGPGGYQLGAFPSPWREWNDQYRDSVRRFWLGERGTLSGFAKHLHGSNYLFERQGRPVSSGINYITSHDGFTLADLVSFQFKHNEQNKENNADGHNHNYSQNFGVEGTTSDEGILAKRLTQQKNFLVTLLLSHGTPMLAGGTEVANSQQGNNNAYCQDNEIGWINWPKSPQQHPLFCCIQTLINIRKRFAVFNQTAFIHDDDPRFDVYWLSANGEAMSANQWHDEDNLFLGYALYDNTEHKALLLYFNAASIDVKGRLPIIGNVSLWKQLVDTHVNTNSVELFMTHSPVHIYAQSCKVFTN
ncbi:glycogen debranching protein GlgX [Thalassotalea marina]|uniref:Glycogen operon protein GlgX homolog n=1 Tax=Thalassotalea marina TaxID=1673741 RepID=A0A919EME5_9GAMM|nr:glycogen debranching protein GlgX [Thalassotalea marina]GHF95134.1 glycogen operon protein GlgX homolog [Thalassotalea marina]